MNQRLTVFLSCNIAFFVLLAGITPQIPGLSRSPRVMELPLPVAPDRPTILALHQSGISPTMEVASSRLDYQEAERLLNQLTTLIFVVGSLLGLIISLLLDKTIRDSQRIKQAHQELERLANLDGLTQIANRRCFEEQLQQEWARAAREKYSLTLILCDVDFFKSYNDIYGYEAGDDCLRQLGQVLARTVKRPGDLAARYGGEEFAVILPNTTAAGGIAVAHQIQDALAQMQLPYGESPVTPYLSLSIGIACLVPKQELSSTILVELSDRALYTAKERGRNQVVCLEQNPGS